MILVDLSQVGVAAYMADFGNKQINEDKTDLFRHVVLNTIRGINSKFKNLYGEMVLCVDSPNSWRKQIFPAYKANRKHDRTEEEQKQWKELYAAFDTVKQELKEYFPYRYIQVPTAEADDIIAVLAKYSSVALQTKSIIISSDHDFVQLKTLPGIDQYAPISKKMVKDIDGLSGKEYLEEHIIRGDSGDGIPNVLSDVNTFITEGTRQTPMTSKKIKAIKEGLNEAGTTLDNTIKERYLFNQKLIDFAYIPDNIREQILTAYQTASHGNRSKMFGYFVNNRLRLLLECINEF